MNDMRKKMKRWWKGRNGAYSTMCREEITNGQVVLTHLAIVVILLACGLAEWVEGMSWL